MFLTHNIIHTSNNLLNSINWQFRLSTISTIISITSRIFSSLASELPNILSHILAHIFCLYLNKLPSHVIYSLFTITFLTNINCNISFINRQFLTKRRLNYIFYVFRKVNSLKINNINFASLFINKYVIVDFNITEKSTTNQQKFVLLNIYISPIN